ncbi:MAG: RHS repeat-associated core domain-containing protein, partial [Candidatus Methylomirabilis oxygeniifera]
VWYNPAGTPGAATLSATDGDIGWGGAALSGWDALFDNLKVGYDADDDDDLDGSDDVVISEDFSSTSVSPTHDDAGNLTKDADYAYVYDAWNNLVRVKAQNDADVVVGVYAYYADNRRASKVVTNRGDLDGVTYFFYDGLREIEERNGAEQVTQQYVWGHEYIDQLLMIRGAGGTWFVHQDANWNVIALTTPSGDVAEEVQYQPYGLPQVRRHLAFGDSDADGDVDSADNTAHTNALTTYNRAFDADFDGDVSNTSGDADQLAWEASYNDPAASTTMVVANRGFSPTGNPFLFTGRRLDAETGLYYYRFRTYHPTLKTFLQRDPLGYVDSASLYQYVGGMPTAAVDPLGEEIVHVSPVGNGPGYFHVYDGQGNYLGTVTYDPNDEHGKAIAERTAKNIEGGRLSNDALKAIFAGIDEGLQINLAIVSILIPGPEDLVGAILIKAFREAGKAWRIYRLADGRVVKVAVETGEDVKKVVRVRDRIAGLALRGKSLRAMWNILTQQMGLKPRRRRSGGWDFVDKYGIVRVSWDPASRRGPAHWHKYDDAGHPMKDSGSLCDPDEPGAHIPAGGGQNP